MKMLVYSCDNAEEPIFRRLAEAYGAELTLRKERPLLENARMAEGMEVVNILSGNYITPEMLDIYKECGVKMVVSRTIGVEHVDVAYAQSIGIAVGNATYSPSSVADYAIMLLSLIHI